MTLETLIDRLRELCENQERIADIETVSDDGRMSSTGLRGQAAGRRAVIAEIRDLVKDERRSH